MTTYTPKTNESDRKHLLQIHAELFPGPDVDTARNMTIDLYNCEACLREREEEIERLQKREEKLIEVGDAMYTHGDFTRSAFNVDSEWSNLTTTNTNR